MKSINKISVVLALVSVFLCVGLVKADIVTDGLITYFSFDAATIDGNTIEDMWGDNNAEILAGVDEVAGKFGQALEFDGSAGKAIFEGDDLNFNEAEELTVAAWILRNGESGGTCCGPIIGQRDLNGWALRDDRRNAGAEIELISSPGWVGDGADFGVESPEGEWHYITGVIGDGQIKLYLDGELAAETAFGAGAIQTNGGTTTELGGAGDGFFNGVIDEALIYNKALSDDEVMQNFQSTRFAAVEPTSKLATSWGEIKK